MFVRWRKGASTSSAYLVQAVRVDGQPRQKIVAQLCTCRTRRLQDEQPDLWGRAEYTIRSLCLDEPTREMIYQALAEKTPRLTPERIEQAVQAYGAAIQERDSRVVSNIPPEITQPDTTDEDIFPFFIKWKAEQARPKFGVPAKFTAFLAKYVTIEGKKRVQVVTRLHQEAMNTEDLQGIVPLRDGTTSVSYRWKQFWYQVHCGLILSQIDEHTYHAIMQRMETWVKRPTEEELFDTIEELQKHEEWHLGHNLKELQRTLNRLSKRDKDLQKIRSRSTDYLGKPLALHPYPSWLM